MPCLRYGAWGLAAAIAAAGFIAGCASQSDNLDATQAVDDPDIGRSLLSMRWRFRAGTPQRQTHPQELASAALDGHRLFVGSDDGVFYALGREDGEVLWKRELGAVSTRPVVEGSRLYVATKRGEILCLDALSGTEHWAHKTGGPILEPPVLDDELLYGANESGKVVALDKAEGSLRWSYEDEGDVDIPLHGQAGIALEGDLLFTGFSTGSLVALEADSGRVEWATSLAADQERFVDIHTTPVVEEGRVYAASVAGGLYALERDSGAIAWRLPLSGAGALEWDEGVLYVSAADEGVYAVERGGHVIWRQGTAGGGVGAEPMVTGDYLIYTLSEAGMYIADRHSGRVLQYFDPGPGITAQPTLEGDDLYVMSNSAKLYAMHLRR